MPVIIPPVVDEGQLLFDESEAREILVFFWPEMASKINAAEMTIEFRCFAQRLLVAAIDASYAMGFVDSLFTTIANPRGGLKKMGQKLARRYVKHWWKHTRPKDLNNVKVYESVRKTVAFNFASDLNIMLGENSARIMLLHGVHVARARPADRLWA
jgi:hypothetical protein